jgi:cbb3-type cytochrome oxidase subunit 3
MFSPGGYSRDGTRDRVIRPWLLFAVIIIFIAIVLYLLWKQAR